MPPTMNNQYWNSLAQEYDDQVMEISVSDLKGVVLEEIRRASKQGRIAADLGCGRGSLLTLLSRHFDSVIAVDYAAELLKSAQAKHNHPNIRFERHNLCNGKSLPFQADVTLCFNALISPNNDQRRKMAKCVYNATKSGGVSLFAVPAFESVIHTFRMVIECQTRQGTARHHAVRSMDKLYRSQIVVPVDGIVEIGGTPTKCYTQEELTVFFTHIGYQIERIRKIEFPWEEEMDNVPKWLKEPYPWDWLVVARKI